MDATKPFKTIEVIDSRTGHVCKVACMSCIRGHRTTSCGQPVCRTKVLWTIKRPGRPANTCTCPYGRIGRCQCVVAQSACPHRPKKGEKRTVDCRCDEQGRSCCVLSPEHWDALMALQKPRVDFYPSPEAMNPGPIATNLSELPSTPAFSAGTPQTVVSLPSTPLPTRGIPQVYHGQPDFNSYQAPAYQPTRLGLMGVGTPMGNEGHQADDILTWEGESPLAPRDFNAFADFTSPDSTAFSNSTILSTAPTTPSSRLMEQHPSDMDFLPVTQSFEQISMAPDDASQLRTDKLMEDYFNYQFPSAICQNCGLNGCTCRSCPAVMQNSIDGSWAQCCSRKHVRVAAPSEQTIPLPSRIPNGDLSATGAYEIDGLKLGGDQPFPSDTDDFGLVADTDMVDFTQFVVTDPDPPSQGCCCGGAR